MKLLSLATFLTVSILTFSSCVGTSPKPSDNPIIDETLPIVQLTKTGVFVDMKAVGFEWKNIEDPRVKGIYIYKQVMGEEVSEYKFYNTINNRFVTHYIDEDVEPASKYLYYFKTYTKEAESKQSQEFQVETLPILDSVSWLHVVQNMPRSAKIIWRPHTNQIVKKYVIQRKTLEEDKWNDLDSIEGRLNAEYIDTELKDDFVYKYRIKVITYNDVISKPSKEVKVITKALPKQVTNVLASNNLPKKIILNWNKANVKDFSHYNIYRADSIDGSYALLTTSKDTQFIDNFEDDGEDYFYRISTVDKDGLESKYELESAHGKTLPRPISPSLVEVMMVGENLEIRWSSTDSRVKSHIVNKTIKKGWIDTKTEEFLDIKGTQFIDSSIEPNTTYYYEVYSVDEFSIKSDPSIEVKFTTTKEQGKVLEIPKEEIKSNMNNQISSDKNNIVQPMDDLDVSSL